MEVYDKPTPCKVCGRETLRVDCPYCRREAQFDDWSFEKKLHMFPPRIQTKFSACIFPPIEGTVVSTYIQGTVGTGKTMYASALAHHILKTNHIEGKHETILFVTMPDLLHEIRKAFDKNSETTEAQIVSKYQTVDWLILDDFGAEENITDWGYKILYLVINHRYDYLKHTIFTSNYSLEQLAQVLNDVRLVSRIAEMCDILEVNQQKRNVYD